MIGLTYIMKLEGITGEELSEKIGVSASAVSQWGKRVRPIPQSRIQLLSMIFPIYPSDLFGKELDEMDIVHLQEAKLKHLRTLCSENDNQAIDRCNQKKNVELKLGAILERDKLIKRISNLFEVTENLETNLANVTIFRSIVKMFMYFCDIEEEMLKNHINRNKASNEKVLSDIKKLSKELNNQIVLTELAIQNNNNDDK